MQRKHVKHTNIQKQYHCKTLLFSKTNYLVGSNLNQRSKTLNYIHGNLLYCAFYAFGPARSWCAALLLVQRGLATRPSSKSIAKAHFARSAQQQLELLAPWPGLLARGPLSPAAPSPFSSITAVRFDPAVERDSRAPYKPSTPMENPNAPLPSLPV